MSVKRVKRDATFDLVSIHDDAVDKDNSDVKAYKRSLNRSSLKTHEGQMPTLFVVKNITQLKRAEFDDEHVKIVMPDNIEEMGENKKVRPKVTIDNSAQLVVKYFNECVVAVKEWDGSKYVESKQVSADEFPSRVVQDIGDQCQVLSSLGEPVKNA